MVYEGGIKKAYSSGKQRDQNKEYTFVVSVVGASLKPTVGVAYLWLLLFFSVWLAAVA